jgi:hypothetical protein
MRTPLVRLAVTVISATLLCGTSVLAQPLAMTDSAGHPLSMFKQIIPSERALPQHENVSPSNEANV